jgi:hypothetical protein
MFTGSKEMMPPVSAWKVRFIGEINPYLMISRITMFFIKSERNVKLIFANQPSLQVAGH